ncbi:hypothetical protein Tco_0912976 [Tanacetum coccineum]
MKDLVANKPKTKEDEEIRMNPRCSALLQNQLPPKEQDLGSFILPCSIRRFGDKEDDIKENLEDPEEYREDKANIIMEDIHDKLNEDWFKYTSEVEDDLEGIILDYLEPKSYDEFIDPDDEAYNERKCRLLGMVYRKPSPILIKKAEVTRYKVGPGETYTKVKVLEIDEMPKTRDNVAAIRAELIDESERTEAPKERRSLVLSLT